MKDKADRTQKNRLYCWQVAIFTILEYIYELVHIQSLRQGIRNADKIIQGMPKEDRVMHDLDLYWIGSKLRAYLRCTPESRALSPSIEKEYLPTWGLVKRYGEPRIVLESPKQAGHNKEAIHQFAPSYCSGV